MSAMASQITSLTFLLNRLFRRRSKKMRKFRFTGIVRAIHLSQKASKAENVSIWWRHHESTIGFLFNGYRPIIFSIYQILLTYVCIRSVESKTKIPRALTYGWPSTQPRRPAHNRASHNTQPRIDARLCATILMEMPWKRNGWPWAHTSCTAHVWVKITLWFTIPKSFTYHLLHHD